MTADVVDGFPVSPQQRRLWPLQSSCGTYRASALVRLVGPLERARLERAVRRVVTRHEILRTRFIRPPGLSVPLQIVESGCAPVMELVGQRGEGVSGHATLPGRTAARAGSLKKWALDTLPLLRLTLECLAPEEHLLSIELPALCGDARTLELFVKELAEGYRGQLANDSPEVTLQYADYAAWREELLSDTEGVAVQKHQSPPPTHKTIPHLPISEFCYETLPLRLQPALETALLNLARVQATDPHVVFLAGWQLLLCRLAGLGEVTLACRLDGRTRPEFGDAFGPYANYSASSFASPKGVDFAELIRRTEATFDAARGRQDYFIAPPTNDEGLPPYAFSMVATPHSHEAEAVSFMTCEISDCLAPFRVELACTADETHAEASLRFDARACSASEIDLLAAQFLALLESLLGQTAAPVGLATFFSDADRHLIADYNGERIEAGSEPYTHRLFEAQAAIAPHSPALDFEQETVSYAELNRRANQLAHWLRSQGVGPEVRVGLCLERSVWLVAAILAVWKVGGAYVALNPESPRLHLAQILEDAAPRVLLMSARLRARLPLNTALLLCPDDDGGALASLPETNPEAPLRPQNLAYVAYTSGSRGRPKGVLACHEAVGNYLSYVRDSYGLESADVALQLASSSFDASVRDIFGPLTAGAKIVLVRDDLARDLQALRRLIERKNITLICSIVPTMLRTLLAAAAEPCRSVRLILTSGEPLAFSDCTLAADVFPSALVANQYGPTECTMTATRFTVVAPGLGFVPAGRPVRNYEVYVLEGRMSLAPVGAAGEVYIGGAGLARGYLNDPDLTARSFVPHPFSPVPGLRLYRTGDSARLRPDGELELLGRLDEQVKVHGIRVEPGEVECALAQHREVGACAVITREGPRGDTFLTACVVPKIPSIGHRVEGLREFMLELVPAHLVPSTFVFLESLPLTHTGKVDRKALIAAAARSEASTTRLRPRNEVEAHLADIWGRLLGLAEIGVEDDFFALGGHSLLAIQLVAEVQERFHVELSVQTIFGAPTIAGIAAAIAERRVDGQKRVSSSQRPTVADASALSSGQRRIYFLHKLYPESAAYVVPTAYELAGPLCVETMARAVGEVVGAHECLRSTFSNAGDQPVRITGAPLPPAVSVVDCRRAAPEERDAAVTSHAHELIQSRFDLERGPLVRLRLLTFADDEHVVLVVFHHIIADAWSVEVFGRALADAYESAARGGRYQPPVTVSYAEFVRWEAEQTAGVRARPHLDYWKKQMDGARILALPTDWPRGVRQTFAGDECSLLLPANASESLRALCRSEGVTSFVALLAVFQTLLAMCSGQEDIVVGVPFANRTRPEFRDIIGPMVNMLSVRGDLSRNPTFRELLQRVREATLGAISHTELPFEKVVEALPPQRDLSRTPVFQASLVLHEGPPQVLRGRDVTWRQRPVPVRTSNFDLTLFARIFEQGVALALRYNSDLFAPATAAALLTRFTALLKYLVARPETRVFDAPLEANAEVPSSADVVSESQPSDTHTEELFGFECPGSSAGMTGERNAR